MITEALLNFLFGAGSFMIGFFPSFEWSCTGMGDLWVFLRWVNTFADLAAWTTVLGMILTAESTALAVKAVLFVYHQVWGSN